MAMDFIGLSVGMGYTDETVIGGGALKGKNCVVSNIEEVADGVNVTFQWTLDNGTVQTETVLLPRGTQGEAGVAGKSAYEIWLEAGNTGTEEDFLISLVGEKGADGTMTFEDLTEEQKESLNGEDGKSAYEIWLEQGNTGTEQDFLDSLKGADGTSVNILGDLTSTDELPDTDQQKGDGYLINGDLWVYTASAEPEAVNGFINVGSIKGPAGNDGFSPTITPNPDNTDDVYKLDITTKDGTFTTPNLRGGDEVTKYTYEGTGNLAGETYYSYEDLSTKIGETVEVTVSNRYGESQDTLTIISKISDTELEVDSGAWIATIMLTNVETTTAELINDNITATTSTWSSQRIANELGQVFDNLTPEQIESLRGPQGDKGEDGKSAYQSWLDEGNTGTEQDFLDSLKGENGVVTEILHTDLTGFDGITTVLDLVNALLEEYRTERKNVRFESGSISNSTLTDLPQDYGYLTIKAGGTNILEVTFAYSNLGFKKMYYGFLNRTADETLYSSLDWKEVTFKDDLSGYAKTSDIDTVNKTIKESICASGIKSTSRTSFKVVAELKEKLSTLQGTYFKFNYIVNNKLNEVDIIVTSSGAYYKHSKGDEIPKEVSYTLENDTSLSIGIKLTNGATGYKHIECPIGSVTSIVISNTFYTGNTIATSY